MNTVIIAGATGDLGKRISFYLLSRGATVKALVRKESSADAISYLKKQGAQIIPVDFNKVEDLTAACKEGSCVVSALSGVEDVMVHTQKRLLEAAIAAGVPRFIPSDFAIDFTKLPYGSNRNLDLRREFGEHIDKAPIKTTSILNGMFTNLLTGQAPVILFGIKRIMYYGNADQKMDFTTIENTAEYTAYAALDPTTPRYLYIAGDVQSPNGLKEIASEVTGEKFKFLRPGGLGLFSTLIKVTKALSPKNDETFPAWQGMQYLHNMLSGLPKMNQLDNNRYPGIHWTTVKEILEKKVKSES